MRISDWSSDVGSSDLLAGGGEEQHRRVGGGDEQLPDGVLVLGRHAGPALATPLLRTEGVQRRALDISAHGHGHDHVLPLDQVFVVDVVKCGDDLGPAWSHRTASTASNSSRITSYIRTRLRHIYSSSSMAAAS